MNNRAQYNNEVCGHTEPKAHLNSDFTGKELWSTGGEPQRIPPQVHCTCINRDEKINKVIIGSLSQQCHLLLIPFHNRLYAHIATPLLPLQQSTLQQSTNMVQINLTLSTLRRHSSPWMTTSTTSPSVCSDYPCRPGPQVRNGARIFSLRPL
jgi:hypothetical protein